MLGCNFFVAIDTSLVHVYANSEFFFQCKNQIASICLLTYAIYHVLY